MRKVMPSELVLNQPLLWSIYDSEGNLLLREGHVLSIPRHINALVTRGAYTEGPSPEVPGEAASTDVIQTKPNSDPVTYFSTVPPPKFHPLSVLSRMDALGMTLERLHNHLMFRSIKTELSTVVRSLAHAVMEAGFDNADALLAACHWDRYHPYLVVQQLLSSALTDLIACELHLNEEARLSLVCAALTRDIALLPVQRQLDQQTDALSAEQVAVVRSHPARTVELLVSMGVDDALWLEFVRQHHERLDGSGYPQALQGDGVLLGARVLAITDSYAAMVTPRPNRAGLLPQQALQALQAQLGRAYDAQVLQSCAQVLTDYPPGTLVRLANGEVGMVRSRKKINGKTDLWAIYNQQGVPLIRPRWCDDSYSAYAISSVLRMEECRSADVVMKRLWSQT